ncbi:hypothetical protein LGQ02_10590 [Bacillus shivajii]|uniref:hypothetical protein n=1 Tax=Bacillus shivajii TaxID=1983719 RepID=UPI001CFBFD74|nr:hypothetical protein [Bacillus shivajii]UCZ55132.1 hypothetical protein LGQ02_10590 [Bacillus shivajii]
MINRIEMVNIIKKHPSLIRSGLTFKYLQKEQCNSHFDMICFSNHSSENVYIFYEPEVNDGSIGAFISFIGRSFHSDQLSNIIVCATDFHSDYLRGLQLFGVKTCELSYAQVLQYLHVHDLSLYDRYEHLQQRLQQEDVNKSKASVVEKRQAIENESEAFSQWLLSADLNASWGPYSLLVSTKAKRTTQLSGKEREFQLYHNDQLVYEGKIVIGREEEGLHRSCMMIVYIWSTINMADNQSLEDSIALTLPLNTFIQRCSDQLVTRELLNILSLSDREKEKIMIILERWGIPDYFPLKVEDLSPEQLQTFMKVIVSIALLKQAALGKFNRKLIKKKKKSPKRQLEYGSYEAK